MPERNLGEDEWNTLIYTIRTGNCILMLGPDASLEKVNGEFRPLAEILANELAKNEKIEEKIKSLNINPGNLPQVAHYYYLKTGRPGLDAWMEEFYKNRAHLTSELHKDLAALPFYFTVSSTPDLMFFNALKEAKKEPVIWGYNFRGKESRSLEEMGKVETPLIFNLYGSIDVPNSLVLTENDLIDFLIALASENPPLPQNVKSELRAREKSFLFLGFGFKHWYLRVLLHILQGGTKKRDAHSYALEQFLQDEEEFHHTILFFESGDCLVHIYRKELGSFVKELRERWENIGEGSTPPPPSSRLPEPPSVFICHANADKDFAGFLYQDLEQAGFKPWLDKEALRGGDDWDVVIKNAIKNDIHYVVILQSSALAERTVGYVNKEINLALDRQDEHRRGVRFIIPAKIEECPLLPELEHLHTIDLSGKKNVDQLIKTIRRDYYHKRKAKEVDGDS